MRLLEIVDESRSLLNLAWSFRTAGLKGPLDNVSLTGLAFSLDLPSIEGNIVYAELTDAQRGVSIIRRIQIISCNRRDHDWKIVAVFQKPLTFDEVTQLSLSPTA